MPDLKAALKAIRSLNLETTFDNFIEPVKAELGSITKSTTALSIRAFKVYDNYLDLNKHVNEVGDNLPIEMKNYLAGQTTSPTPEVSPSPEPVPTIPAPTRS